MSVEPHALTASERRAAELFPAGCSYPTVRGNRRAGRPGKQCGRPVVYGWEVRHRGTGRQWRIGRCDEQLTNAGITHLAEHLLLPVDQTLPVHANGVDDVSVADAGPG